MFNVQRAVVETKRFTRESKERGQSFKFKFRVGKAGNYFLISKGLFTMLSLESNGLVVLPSREEEDENSRVESVGLLVVPQEHDSVTIFKGGKGSIKTKKFNNSVLEAHLIETGLISAAESMIDVDQKLDLAQYESKVSINAEGVPVLDKKGYPLYVITAANPEEVLEGAEWSDDTAEEVAEEAAE